jgi:hypothetical protein
MIEQYRLRLRDGTVLTVDHGGLRSWLMDERTMVQPPGSQRWRPLKKFLAEHPTAPTPPRVDPAPVTPEPQAARPQTVPAPPAPPRPEPEPPRRVEAPAPTLEPRPMLSPLAETTGPPSARRRDDGIPIIPFKPLEDGHRPARVKPPVPAPNLYEVALAEVERHGGSDAPWQWTPPKARPAPIAEEAAAEPPAKAQGAPPATSRWKEEPVAIKLAPPDPSDEEMILEELELVEESAAPPPTLPDVLRDVAGQAGGVLHGLLQRGRAWAPPPARVRSLARTWGPRALLATSVMAVLVIVVATRATWMRVLFAPQAAQRVAPPAPPAPATPEPSPLPRAVQAAVAQLPHLSTDVIQLVMAHGGPALPDPPEVFRRAWVAANRGASALSETDAEELRSIRKAVLFSLRPAERDRVRAYDRVSVSVDLLVLEDGKVMALFTRGVRALSPPRRERLQALLGKAITAALPPPAVADAHR